jgi:F-type H+-transporting ATPase subunit epsilon
MAPIRCRTSALDTLEAQVRLARAKRLDVLRGARVEQTRLHAQAVRQLLRYLRPGAPAAVARVDGHGDAEDVS